MASHIGFSSTYMISAKEGIISEVIRNLLELRMENAACVTLSQNLPMVARVANNSAVGGIKQLGLRGIQKLRFHDCRLAKPDATEPDPCRVAHYVVI